jgi:5-methylcytosine-specific restriction endonuclease McrA
MSLLRKVIARRDPCAFCGGPGGTIDHVVPRSSGGRNVWSNVAGACWQCNHDKAAVSLLEFLLARCGMVALSAAGEE